MDKAERKRIFWLSVAAVGPCILFSIYLVFSQWPPRRFAEEWDFVALALSMLLAIAALVVLFRGRDLLVAICVFIPTAAFLVGLSSLFIGCAFGKCL